ncbi:hypothetical protein Tco_1370660 [Tanacetum coccineum]
MERFFKNLWRLINSGMSSNSKVGLGFEIQSNNEVLSYEEEMNFSVFNCSKEDSVGKPLYSRFTKTNDFKGSIGTSSEHSVDPESEISSVPPEVYVSTPITSNEKGVSDPKSKEVESSCVTHIKTPRQPIKDQATLKVNRKNWNVMMKRELREGYSFTKKKCFVYGSLSHLIKDCDYYEKKMARVAEVKKQRVFNTGRTNINSIRPNINTGRTNINHVRPRVNTGSSNVNTVRTRQSYLPRPQTVLVLKDHSLGIDVKTSAVHPLKNMVDKGIFDSGCSGHMTGNKDQLDDFEECIWGSITFGATKVLFMTTECLVVSSDFKMPDENQILLKVPRHHNMYNFDMKTPTPAKGFACLIAKALLL